MRRSRIAAPAALLALLACARVAPLTTRSERTLAAEVQAPGLLFEVLYTKQDEGEVARIQRGLLAIGPRLSRWGNFRSGVYIRIYPDHESLEEAVDRRGYPWLRAWAFGDQVLLQSPRSWGAANDGEVDELLLHELTHSLMYQLIQPESSRWPPEEPPLWFREGMASVTADQGHRRLSPEELAHWLAAHPGADVLNPSAELYRTEKDAVYGAAHRAFDLLVRLHGDEKVRAVLHGMSAGANFADAFRAGTGESLGEFEEQAVRSGFALSAAPHGAGGP